MIVERYSHVMHIVSNVHGELDDDHSAYDVLRATFPAGTVSGAPKIRAMQIINELEKSKRCTYSGAVGYFGWDGGHDSCITLRTCLLKDGKAYVQAGAGVVADSNPTYEYEETVNKSMAIIRAIGLAKTIGRQRPCANRIIHYPFQFTIPCSSSSITTTPSPTTSSVFRRAWCGNEGGAQ